MQRIESLQRQLGGQEEFVGEKNYLLNGKGEIVTRI
jgi:hypothetical protein